ncbi:WXG100 family type VII secretion target [Nocardioides hwasunensis]|uniref:WXG100 family type VII secretion target n=1 Tax=Nocardioides hwasunensis TaxID=397258 RepID=A0ABR8MHC6_9ACTN|nr:WXG100 family type VII secretion target [Nocardioides hwasunensis]MBD3915318.1 WXG100 family type VII secretion target [Nocardioides hwasunensis]
MTSFDVDLDELRAAVHSLATCHRELISLAAEIDRAQGDLRDGWRGAAADAEEATYARWRSGRDDMAAALSALRAIALAADDHYSRAVARNLASWRQVTA